MGSLKPLSSCINLKFLFYFHEHMRAVSTVLSLLAKTQEILAHCLKLEQVARFFRFVHTLTSSQLGPGPGRRPVHLR